MATNLKRNIAQDTANVGNALTSVRIDQMIVNLATGIALGQFQLDKTSIDITRMMGLPEQVNIGGKSRSMLEIGILPTFYHFVDTILEIKMEINIREELDMKKNVKESMGAKLEVEGRYGVPMMGVKAKMTAAYSRTIDTTHAQKFSQDLNAQSLMRTKLVPKPPPEILIRLLEEFIGQQRESAEGNNETLDDEMFSDAMFTEIGTG